MALSYHDLEQIQPPRSVADLGVPVGIVEDLFLRKLCAARHSTIGDIATSLGVSTMVGTEIAESLRDKKLLMYQGTDGRDYRITPTEMGMSTTADRMKLGTHSGMIPVPMQQYQTLVELQRSDLEVSRDSIQKAFRSMIVEDYILDQVGPAMTSSGAVLLYGPSGTGKSTISEKLIELYDDVIAIPRYVIADDQIISVFDPSVHSPVEDQPDGLDPRFVICRRPIVIVGGELELKMLELQYDSLSGISQAPIHMMANNGILLIDDFGRQAFRPAQLLNRWILPLASGVDYLQNKSGSKLTIPFAMKLIFSTNIEPAKLGDEAFLRRLRSKIFVGPCSRNSFDWIIEKVAANNGLVVQEQSKDWIASICQSYLGELRPYIAVDICELAVDVARYEGSDLILTESLIAKVADLFFVKDASSSPKKMPQFNAPMLDNAESQLVAPQGDRRG